MPDPIFIIGAPRSGTSVLTWCLGQHSKILTVPETDWLTALASWVESRRTHSTCDRCIAAGYHSMVCGYAMAERDAMGNQCVEFAEGWQLLGSRLVRSDQASN